MMILIKIYDYKYEVTNEKSNEVHLHTAVISY